MKNFTLARIKKFIDKAMLEEPINPFLDKCYHEVNELVGHGQPYYKLFYHIAKELKPKTVIELGGWRGYGSAHFAAGNPNGLVISIDHHSDPGDDINQQIMYKCITEYKNMRYVRGWTTHHYIQETNKGRNGLPDVLDILNGQTIDILFIDSWHEEKYFLRDWKVYSRMLSPLSLVIADDLMNTELFKNMEEVWETIPGQKFVDGNVHWGIPMGFAKIDRRPKKSKQKSVSKRNVR